jgi:hypothetical protein
MTASDARNDAIGLALPLETAGLTGAWKQEYFRFARQTP